MWTSRSSRGFRLGLAVALTVAVSSCATMTVHTEYDRAMSFPGYQTFSWRGGSVPGGEYPELSSAFVEDQIRDAVSRELGALGLTGADAGETDLLIDFHMSARQQVEVVTYHEDDWEERRDFSYTKGTLLVDILDASDESLIWRGRATGVVDNPSPEWVSSRIDEAVTKMFHEHPFGS